MALVDDFGNKRRSKEERRTQAILRDAHLTNALIDIQEHGMKIRAAGRLYNIPESTIRRKLLELYPQKEKVDSSLSKEEEKIICSLDNIQKDEGKILANHCIDDISNKGTDMDIGSKKRIMEERKWKAMERDARLKDALRDILENGKKIRTAGRHYNVPEATLRRKLLELNPPKEKVDRSHLGTILSKDKEDKIISALENIQKNGMEIEAAGRLYDIPEYTLRRKLQELNPGKEEVNRSHLFTTFSKGLEEKLANHCSDHISSKKEIKDERKKKAIDISNKRRIREERKMKSIEREAHVKDALDDIQENGKKIRTAGRQYQIPEATLRRKLLELNSGKGFVNRPYLFTTFSQEQEEMLANHCISMSQLGHGYTSSQIVDMAANMAEAIGAKRIPTKSWFYQNFLRRFPQIKIISEKRIKKSREVVTQGIIDDYYNSIEEALNSFGIKDDPANIWNLDETGISLDYDHPKMVANATDKAYCVTAGKSPTMMLITAVSAGGQTIPPYFIFKGERATWAMREGNLPGTVFKGSPSGWSSSNIFLDFFKNHLLKHVKQRPLLLLHDHSTHYTDKVKNEVMKDKIHMFAVPPQSSSSLLQPLDVTVFNPFKVMLSTNIDKWMHEHPTRVIIKDDLPGLMCSAFEASMDMDTIMSEFQKIGICPFNKNAVTTTEKDLAPFNHLPYTPPDETKPLTRTLQFDLS